MSVQFNDTSTYKGLIQLYEKEIGANRGDISGDSNKLKEATADINLAWDDYLELAISASGLWQFDDSNQTDYPIIKTNIVSGQRDYSFTTDGTGNLILDIYKVAILPSATATLYEEIFPIDQQSKDSLDGISSEDTATATPFQYDKTANAIFLDPKPGYNATNGLKLWINREPSYFTSADTTKKPGCPGLHHRYFALRPAEDYARRNSLAVYPSLRDERMKMEQEIQQYFSRRSKDERPTMTPEFQVYE